MSFTSEFKEFAMKGSVVDLAVGVVIGAAFGKIVTSFVNDLLMPPLGALTGGVDFSDKKIVLKQAVLGGAGQVLKPENAIRYGSFINNVIDFLIVALAIFAVIKLINQLSRKKKEEAPPEPPKPTREEELLAE